MPAIDLLLSTISVPFCNSATWNEEPLRRIHRDQLRIEGLQGSLHGIDPLFSSISLVIPSENSREHQGAAEHYLQKRSGPSVCLFWLFVVCRTLCWIADIWWSNLLQFYSRVDKSDLVWIVSSSSAPELPPARRDSRSSGTHSRCMLEIRAIEWCCAFMIERETRVSEESFLPGISDRGYRITKRNV